MGIHTSLQIRVGIFAVPMAGAVATDKVKCYNCIVWLWSLRSFTELISQGYRSVMQQPLLAKMYRICKDLVRYNHIYLFIFTSLQHLHKVLIHPEFLEELSVLQHQSKSLVLQVLQSLAAVSRTWPLKVILRQAALQHARTHHSLRWVLQERTPYESSFTVTVQVSTHPKQTFPSKMSGLVSSLGHKYYYNILYTIYNIICYYAHSLFVW